MQSGGPHIETFCLPCQSKACLGSALTHRARYNAETQSVVDRGRDARLVPTAHCGRLTKFFDSGRLLLLLCCPSFSMMASIKGVILVQSTRITPFIDGKALRTPSQTNTLHITVEVSF